MSLRDVLETVRDREKTLTVHARHEPVADELREYFASQNVTVHYRHSDVGEPERVVLSEGGAFKTSVDLESMAALVGEDTPPKRVGEDVPYQAVLSGLDGSTFTSYDRRQMLHATREIEDRAWRVGIGTLHAGFQTFSIFERERETYERLAQTDLDLHVHGAPDVPPPDIDGVALHPSDDPDITDTWFAVYDGGPDEQQKSALLAEERTTGRFYGAWTYDADLVDRALGALRDHRRTST